MSYRARRHTGRSLAAKNRLALLVEGADALVAVLGRDQPVVGLDLEHERVLQVHLQAVMDRLLGLAHGERRVRRNGARRFDRILEESLRRAETVDDAPAQR